MKQTKQFSRSNRAIAAVLAIFAASCASMAQTDDEQTAHALTATGTRSAPSDFDGDGKSDRSIWDPNSAQWYIVNSRTGNSVAAGAWGLLGDIPVSGDFDNDNTADRAIFRPSTGEWWAVLSKTGVGTPLGVWGTVGDIPVSGDFDGDGATDRAVYRAGQWFAAYSSTGVGHNLGSWGGPSDIPVAGDFDGDGKTDLTVYRPSTGEWWVTNSNQNFDTAKGGVRATLGNATDIPVAGDFDNNGITDFAVWRPGTGDWLAINSKLPQGGLVANWGLPGDVPILGDFDGVGGTDPAVWRPETGEWFAITGGAGTNLGVYGGGGQVPLPYQGGTKIGANCNRIDSCKVLVKRAPGRLDPWAQTTIPADLSGSCKAICPDYQALAPAQEPQNRGCVSALNMTRNVNVPQCAPFKKLYSGDGTPTDDSKDKAGRNFFSRAQCYGTGFTGSGSPVVAWGHEYGFGVSSLQADVNAKNGAYSDILELLVGAGATFGTQIQCFIILRGQADPQGHAIL